MPFICQKLKETIERRKAELERATQEALNGSVTLVGSSNARPFLGGDIGPRIRADYPGILANIVVIAGFTLFAFIVKYVLRNISIE